MRPFSLDERIETVHFTIINAHALTKLVSKTIESNKEGLFNASTLTYDRVTETVIKLEKLSSLLMPLYNIEQAGGNLCDLKDIFEVSQKLDSLCSYFQLEILENQPSSNSLESNIDGDLSNSLFGIDSLLCNAREVMHDLIKMPLAA